MTDEQRHPGRLSPETKHLLRLIRKDQDSEGWTKVSELLWPFAIQLPYELVTMSTDERKIRLTEVGNIVVDWL